MKEPVPGQPGWGTVVVDRPPGEHQSRKHPATRCSICTRRIWFSPVHLTEPHEVAEPRFSWVLCKSCHAALQYELAHSPVRSPLRLRIAMGIVAADRWSQAYLTRKKSYLYDRRWVVFVAVGCIIAMILHLVIVVMIAMM
ncbi:MAG: hypothetical protein IMW89_02285 [Ktedonobacteraceae bacterium]|nr:hypothetical protein [Ktedonobacteraceae bacterium]